MKQNVYENTIQQTLVQFDTTTDGLSDEAVIVRRKKHGANVLPQPPMDNTFIVFLRQFKSPLVYILVVVTVIVLVFGEYTDGIVIALVLLLNAVVGTIQEGRAQNTLAALRKFSQTQTLVRRHGMEELIVDTELVPGDIVLLREGDKVPADGRFIAITSIIVDEASLTGESEPVVKITEPLHPELPATKLYSHEQRNMAFKGTHVVAGSAEILITATGLHTEIGKLSETIVRNNTEIPLQVNIRYLSKVIMYMIGGISVVLFGIGILSGRPILDMVKTVISLAVSVIPEGLPVVLTLVLANGVWRMSQRKALVKKLAAVEALGQATVIAVDKTGTITRNELIVKKIVVQGKEFEVAGSGYEPIGDVLYEKRSLSPLDVPELVIAGKIASFASAELLYVPQSKQWKISGDPTEGALLVLAQKIGFKPEDMAQRHPILQEIPFSYTAKYRAIVFKNNHTYMLAVVGAPEAVGGLCGMNPDAVHRLVNPLSKDGLRVIAFGFIEVAGQVDPNNLPNLIFGGLYGMQDTLHTEVPAAVDSVQSAGIRVVMITGDHRLTAQSIAQSAHIYRPGDIVITGHELDTMTPDVLQEKLKQVSVFARVTPDHKLRIVQALQARGDVVAMTGDGVNDVPSLVAADLGVAMGITGTEVTKEAADIVLLDDNFTTIAAAVEEGRNIYKTIYRALLYLFSTGLGELFVIVAALLLGAPLPVIAVQILWLNFVTDGFLTVAFAMEPKEKDLLRADFRKPSRYVVDTLMLWRMVPMGLIMMLGTLWLFYLYDDQGYVKATTVAVTVLAVFQWFNAWNCRSEKRSAASSPFSNPYLIAATIIVILLQVMAVYVPFMQRLLKTTTLTLYEWCVIMLVASSVLVWEEIRKYIARNFK